jgi:predicted lipoprotein
VRIVALLAAAASVAACGASDVPPPENQFAAASRDEAVPDRLRAAYAEITAARFALAACRAPRERQAIDAADRRRGELELAMAQRLGADRVAALRAASQEAALRVQVQLCPGENGLARLARAEAELAAAGARAGVR